MKYKVGDKVKVKNEFDIYEEYRGKQFVIEECDSSDDTYLCHPITGGYRIWFSEEKLEPVDSKTLRMADGTIIGKFNTGGVVSIHDLPTSEWYNPIRVDLHEFVFDAEQAKELAERLNKELAGRFNAFPNDGISAKNGGKNSMKCVFYERW